MAPGTFYYGTLKTKYFYIELNVMLLFMQLVIELVFLSWKMCFQSPSQMM